MLQRSIALLGLTVLLTSSPALAYERADARALDLDLEPGYWPGEEGERFDEDVYRLGGAGPGQSDTAPPRTGLPGDGYRVSFLGPAFCDAAPGGLIGTAHDRALHCEEASINLTISVQNY